MALLQLVDQYHKGSLHGVRPLCPACGLDQCARLGPIVCWIREVLTNQFGELTTKPVQFLVCGVRLPPVVAPFFDPGDHVCHRHQGTRQNSELFRWSGVTHSKRLRSFCNVSYDSPLSSRQAEVLKNSWNNVRRISRSAQVRIGQFRGQFGKSGARSVVAEYSPSRTSTTASRNSRL